MFLESMFQERRTAHEGAGHRQVAVIAREQNKASKISDALARDIVLSHCVAELDAFMENALVLCGEVVIHT